MEISRLKMLILHIQREIKCIHNIYGIHCAGEDSNQVIVVQKLAQKGSLRDELYQVLIDL